MKERVFTGAATAIVTPFNQEGVDYENFERMIEWQIKEGINAIVACGTTGEATTLTEEEHKAVIKFTVDKVAGRVPVIAGTGSNNTAHSIEMTKYACEVGADAILAVTPYYNKTTQKGLIQTFTAIADASTKPVILYNVPGRTGMTIAPETYAALAEHPNIIATKEASGDISNIAKTVQLCGDNLDIISGNDDQIVPLLSLGGIGVISVLSNVMPKETVEICNRWFEGDVKGSAELQLELLPFINSLFCEVNPIPVKAAVAAIGYCENRLRLPLICMEDANREKMVELMSELGLNLV
ncbi:MAG: 4-hydroxy-tetrahydrodipicolinate synthase [Gudongella sp.]|jgi:4-hydroxy-tetrahydrodipicolinate synthase|nr:4-hydroxy-tetrahydrodipicolinate synthase [Gudongella sp.]